MKKGLMFAVAVVAVSILVSGCTGINTPVTATYPGGVYTDTTGGVMVNVPVRPLVEKYKVIKQNVIGKATSINILSIIAIDDSSYGKAFDNIIKDNPGTDEVIDIKIDVKKESVLMIVQKTTTIVRGTAIKYLGKDR